MRLFHDEERTMRYLCLTYSEERTLDAMPEGEFNALADEHVALIEELQQSGHYVASDAPQPVHTATTVRGYAAPLW
jgi:hypothetical protein